MTKWRTLILAVLIALVAGPDLAASQPRGHKWWQSPLFKTELGLAEEQSQRMEEIFQATLPVLREGKERLDREEAELERLLSEATVAEADVVRKIDRVEAARSELAKARTLMLFRMHQVLTIEQRERLHALHERLKRESRTGQSREH